MQAVKIENLRKTFGKETVLQEISLTFETGRMYALVGRNGSGKSVLLKCISGLVVPSGGSIEVGGKVLGRDVDFAPDTGISIEQPGLLLRKSAFDNMKILSALTQKPCASEINRLIELVGLNPKDKKAVGKYSMGMKQRLSIAMALLGNPKLLLLDEPMSNLDISGANEMRSLFRQLANEGKTIIIATHVQEDVDALCDEVCYLEAGKIKCVKR